MRQYAHVGNLTLSARKVGERVADAERRPGEVGRDVSPHFRQFSDIASYLTLPIAPAIGPLPLPRYRGGEGRHSLELSGMVQ